jgi:hypothetical protein
LSVRKPTKFQRYVIGALVLGAMVGAYFFARSLPGSQQAEFDLLAEAGKTTISLYSKSDEISPGCGCLAPEFGRHPWVGMSLPSAGFDLGVVDQGGAGIDEGLWSLTMMQPDVAPTDWYSPPVESIRTKVEIQRRGESRRLFSGRTTYLVAWSDRRIGVEQSRTNPYAAILPAAGGQTTVSSREASRSQRGGALDLSAEAPERPHSCTGYSESSNQDCALRGPMVDLLGPTERFTIPITNRLRLWTGMQEVGGLGRGGTLTISVTVPFSLRLYAHPVQSEWEREMPKEYARRVAALGTSGRWERREIRNGPREQGRFIMNEPLPRYEVSLRDLQSPTPGEWRSFARRSQTKDVISPMLGEGPADHGRLIVGEYALPPVTPKPQVLVFGEIKSFESDSVRGHAVVGSAVHPIARGEELHFESDQGIGAGIYKPTPLISDGPTTQNSSVSGDASIWVDGDVVTHPPWLPWIPVGAMIGVFVGLLLTGGVNWIRGNDLKN